ncbi:Ankyrin repeat-containing protein NPR4 [Bienertia sinuspersici]
MDPKVYEAAVKGSFKAMSSIQTSNWKVEETPTKNNILHLHVGKSSLTFKNASMRDMQPISAVNIDFIEHVLNDEEGYWLLWKQNNNGESPLHLAAKFGHYNAVQLFLEHAKKVHQHANEVSNLVKMSNKYKDTALHEAARGGHAGVVRLLLEADANCDTHHEANAKGETPLYLAAEKGSTPSVCSILPTASTDLITYKEMVQKILEKDRWLMNIQDDEGLTPLHSAVTKRTNIQILKILINNINNHKRESSSPSSSSSSLSLSLSSVLYIEDNKGRTPLHIAMLQHNTEALDKLIESCPDCIEITDENGQNVLHYAAKWYCKKAMKWVIMRAQLLDKYINDKDNDGKTPLHVLAETICNHPDLLYIFPSLWGIVLHYPSIDLMAFDNDNRTVGDILDPIAASLGRFEREIAHRFPLGRRSNVYERNIHDIEKGAIDNGGEMDIKAIKKAAESRLVVAALIATVSFTAAFTVPGGLVQNEGKDMGMAIFRDKFEFKVFIVSNAAAFLFSTLAILCYFVLVSAVSKRSIRIFSLWGLILNTISLGALIIAFQEAVHLIIFDELSIIVGIFVELLFFYVYYRLVYLAIGSLRALIHPYSFFRFHLKPRWVRQ